MEEKKSWPNWGIMLADAWRNWEKPVKEPVALFIEPNCPTCRQELYLGCPAHWAVTDRNDLAHKSETQGQQELEQWVVPNAAHNRGPSFGIRDVCSTTHQRLEPVCGDPSCCGMQQQLILALQTRQDKTRVTEHLSYPQSVHVTCTSKDRAYVTCSQSDSRPSSLLGAFAKQLKKSSYWLRHICPPVTPSARIRTTPTEISYFEFLSKFVDSYRLRLKLGKINI